MALLEYGYTSKVYPFGTVNGSGGVLPTAAPTRMIVTASYFAAPGETVKIRVWNGAVSGPAHLYQTVLSYTPGGGSNVNLLDQELTLASFAPASLAAWQTIIKASITCDETSVTPYAATESVNIYVATDRNSGLSLLSTTPITLDQPKRAKTGLGLPSNPVNRIPSGGKLNAFLALQGAQIQFFAKGTNLQLLTAVSDINGIASGKLPPGSYEVRAFGPGFTQADWLTGDKSIAVGMSTTLSPFAGDTTSTTTDVGQAADFGYVKNMFAGFRWVGYMVVEDFTSSRVQFRNETADATDAFGNTATYNFGRLYKGQSWIEFVGIGLDPQPL